MCQTVFQQPASPSDVSKNGCDCRGIRLRDWEPSLKMDEMNWDDAAEVANELIKLRQQARRTR